MVSIADNTSNIPNKRPSPPQNGSFHKLCCFAHFERSSAYACSRFASSVANSSTVGIDTSSSTAMRPAAAARAEDEEDEDADADEMAKAAAEGDLDESRSCDGSADEDEDEDEEEGVAAFLVCDCLAADARGAALDDADLETEETEAAAEEAAAFGVLTAAEAANGATISFSSSSA